MAAAPLLSSLLNQGDVTGQKRTGNAKSFLVYKASTPDKVYKGPYPPNPLTDKRFKALHYRTVALQAWGVKNVMFPSEYLPFPSTVYGDGKPCIGVVFRNLLQHFPVSFEPYTEKSGIQYYVSTDPGISKLSKLLPARLDLLTPELLKSLIYLYILGTGDMGLYNVVVTGNGNGEVMIIDYEETATKDYEFYLTKMPAKTSGAIEKFQSLYPLIIQDIQNVDLSTVPAELGMSKEELERRKNRILMVLLGVNLQNEMAVAPFTPPPQPVFVNAINVTPPPAQGGFNIPMVSPGAQPVAPLALGNIGQMKDGGMRGTSYTYHGYTTSLIKSALQKNIRRGNVLQAEFCAFELYGMKALNAYHLVHNMYNRLAVISCEDVTPLNLALPATIVGWVTDKIRGTYDPAELAAAVQLLAVSPKSRIMSHYWRAYTVPEGRAYLRAKQPGVIVEEGPFQANIKDFDQAAIAAAGMAIPPYLKGSDYQVAGGTIFYLSVMIYERLKRRDPNAIVWIDEFIKQFEKTQVERRHGRTKAEVILWDIIMQFIPQEYALPLMKGYFTLSENRPCIMVAVSNVLLNKDKSTKMIEYAQLFAQTKEAWNVQAKDSLTMFQTFQYGIIIEPYMNDMHVKGKKKGEAGVAQRHQFVHEGAHVENQDPDALIPVLKEVYDNS